MSDNKEEDQIKYLAHIDGDREQTMEEHSNGVAKLAREFAGQFGKEDWGYACGILHDIGKYSLKFQNKIQSDSSIQVDHSTAGAKLCFEMGGFYHILSYCIAGHHAGLPNTGSALDGANESSLMGRKQKNIQDYSAYKKDINNIPELKTLPFDPAGVTNPPFSLSVFIRMLYSCLVDADFLDTENFMKNGQVGRDSGENMKILLKKLEKYISKWLNNKEFDTVNGRRTEILQNCLNSGVKDKGLFRLTVPTGGGKTLASLAFALKHAVAHHMERIIYVIPYTSIIEQNAEIFRTILGDQNVLENHCNVDYENSEEFKPMQLASENWDKPVIVTTNVQFFESLFANKSSKCRKLHNISNSVIIFDEAQMLPNDYLKPCIAMMEELLTNYGTSIVLCTATQPALTEFFRKDLHSAELCPRMNEQFSFFKRNAIHNIGTITGDELIGKLQQEYQSLCIVNRKKRAQTLYTKLKGEGVYHLSTTMYPKHRKRVLAEIRGRLKDKEKCILVATSLVEAGVDLDFRSVYRQLAGVDSIIQAAGRCNREGRNVSEESIVSVFQFDGKEYMPGQRQQMDITHSLLADQYNISGLDTIDKYFKMLYHFRGDSLDKKKIMNEFKNNNYNFAKVGREFKLIEENTKTVFIPVEEEAKTILQELKYQGFTKLGMRKANQYCVNIYDNEFEKYLAAGMVRLVSEDIEDFYELVRLDQYTEEMGLNLNIDLGMAVMF